MEWHWTTWFISVGVVVVSGAIAWAEGNWTRRPGLAMGFSNHGGMWGDLVLLPMANAAIASHLTVGVWIAGAIAIGTVASVWAHIHWYRPARIDHSPSGRDRRQDHETIAAVHTPRGDHMWPARLHGTWWRDLSWSGWSHVLYVAGELTLLIGFLLHPAPADVVLLVAAIFTAHVPIGLLQPRWYMTGHIATVSEQPLLAPLLLALWAVTAAKL